MHRHLLGYLLLLAVLPVFAQDSTPEITAAEIRDHVRYLASDDLKGRGSGTDGNTEAAIYIAAKLKLWGLKPAGVNATFFQPFDFVSAVKLGPENLAVLETKDGKKELLVDRDFRPFGFSATGSATAPLAFVGYGITAPDKEYDDYAGMDVKGKIVVMFRFGPDGTTPTSEFQRYTGLRNKARIARDNGAAAMIMINGPLDESEDSLYKLALEQGAGSSGIMAVSMKREHVVPLFTEAGWDLKTLQDTMRARRTPLSFDLGTGKLTLSTEIVRVTSQTSNIMAYLEGNDPILKNEVIILGAHMDHLGMGGPGSGSMMPDTIAIHNGADDNASGTAALLELAQAYAARASGLKRSFLFLFFSGEELGTLGSNSYVESPFFPLTQSVVMVNLDMVGRMQNRTLTVGGTGTSPAWPDLLNRHNSDSAFTIVMNPDGFGPSDHAPFYGKDVPVLFFFTGVHDDYHKPSDDWDKLDYPAEQKITRYVYGVVNDIDTMHVRPGFTRVQIASSGRGGQGDRRGFSVTLGIVPDVGESTTGMKISGVRPNGAAEKAGLKSGDIITAMAGKKVLNIYDYMGVLGELKAGDEVPVEITRDGKTMTVTALMQKRN